MPRNEAAPVDHARIFAGIPTPYLVMSPELVILDANEAYLRVVGRSREDIIGRPVFEAFPPTPDALDPSGVSRVQLSFERARDTGVADTMPLQEYDIHDPVTGRLTERFWSLISVPIPGADGRTEFVVQRTEDVTDYVHERERTDSAARRGAENERRVQEVEADLFARGQELRAALAAKEAAGRRISALAEVALQLAHADTVQDLARIVIEHGFAVLGADGGAIAVRGPGRTLDLTVTDSLGEGTRLAFGQLPLDGDLPGSVTAATGRRILLADRDASRAFTPAMDQVLEETGCEAWACLPLTSGGLILGSLSVGWKHAHAFSAGELGTLDALAAQCAYGLERITAREAERAAAAGVRRMSETLQRSMLTDPPQPDHLHIAVRYRPAADGAQVGGDWYDAFLTPDGATNLVIGDVAGHDGRAAAAMGQIRNTLRGVAYALQQPPDLVLGCVDRALRDLGVTLLATAVLARIEQSEGDAAEGLRQLRWSNAGHTPPLLLLPDGTATLLTTEPDLLLGLDPGTTRASHLVTLPVGATVVFYTDGLIERRGTTLDDGLAWLVDAGAALAHDDLETLCDKLLAQAGPDTGDDIAVLALRAHDQRAPRPPDAGPEYLPAADRVT